MDKGSFTPRRAAARPGLAGTLPHTLTAGLARQGVPHAVAAHVGVLPPVSSLFAAILGVNPVQHMLARPASCPRCLPQRGRRSPAASSSRT
ncbi:MAG TPA: hypothetical protein VIV12_14945 [Streptosporangiaceae bacterium]